MINYFSVRQSTAIRFVIAGFAAAFVLSSFGIEAAAQETRSGKVDTGRSIGFMLAEYDFDENAVEVRISPNGIVEASLRGNLLKVKGLAKGTAKVRVSGMAGDPQRAFVETFSISVGEAKRPEFLSPKTVRDYFMLLTDEYFVMEGCKWETDQDCEQAKREYLRDFLEVDDPKNGYLKAGCDGAQNCLEMAVFRKPDSTHLVGISVTVEGESSAVFLEFRDSAWVNVSEAVIPDFSEEVHYELPRNGTTMRVFEKVWREDEEGYERQGLGRHLYSLKWEKGGFARVKVK